MSSPGARLTREELIKLINTLIDNHFIKDFLIKESLMHTLEQQRSQQHRQSNKEMDLH
jgi:hypothetical protein